MSTPLAEKKGSRFSRLLGGNKEKAADTPPAFPPDSAYASSDTPTSASAPDKSTPEFLPVEKTSDIGKFDQDKNLAVKPSTGEVLDRDTGEIVTVVTTTTTTTTTTTRKPGKNEPDVRKEVKEVTQTQPAIDGTAANTHTADRSGVAEMPANSSGPSTLPALPPPVMTSVPDRNSSRLRKQSPSIPAKSANRRSGDRYSYQPTISDAGPDSSYFARPGPTGNTPPISPTGTNFSYPARNRNSMDPSGAGLTTADQPQHHSKSTMADLRAAAKGIHGVGETLRGTLNNTVDEAFPRKNATKAAAAHAKNEAVLTRGRTEMHGIQHGKQLPPQPSQHPIVKPPSPQRTETHEQAVPGSWSPDYDDPEADGHLAPANTRETREKEKSRSISKLFKRKPVKEGELRVTNP